MTTRADIGRRLAKLEKAVPEPAIECAESDWFVRMETCVLAFHLGDVQPDEPVVAAYARALGYGDQNELKREPGASEHAERHEAAMGRLFAQRGIDIAATPFEAYVHLLDKLVPALPEWMMTRVGIPAGVTATDALL